MAYGPSEDLQRMIYARLTDDAGVIALVSDRIFDKPPAQETFPYIAFTLDDWVEDDADCITGGEYSVQVDIWSQYHGRLESDRIMDAVKKALHGYEGALTDHALVFMRVAGMRWLDEPDGITSHGVITVQAMVEEAAT